jgi:hypothetical protein
MATNKRPTMRAEDVTCEDIIQGLSDLLRRGWRLEVGADGGEFAATMSRPMPSLRTLHREAHLDDALASAVADALRWEHDMIPTDEEE